MAPKPLKSLRENVVLNDGDWSPWNKAIRSKNTEGYVKRGEGQVGYRKENMDVPNGSYCGIYEWKIVKSSPNETGKVVYVGSTCRKKAGSLSDRIQEYCNNGSHKESLFNEYIRGGYDLWYRTKRAPDKVKAEDMENKLLDSYNYRWNVRRNYYLRRCIAHFEVLN